MKLQFPNVLVRCRPSIFAQSPAVQVYSVTGLASADLLGRFKCLWSKNAFRSLPDRNGCARCVIALDAARRKGADQNDQK